MNEVCRKLRKIDEMETAMNEAFCLSQQKMQLSQEKLQDVSKREEELKELQSDLDQKRASLEKETSLFRSQLETEIQSDR